MACVLADGKARMLRDPGARAEFWQTSVARQEDGPPLVGVLADRPGTTQGAFRGRFLHALGQAGQAPAPGALGSPSALGPPQELLAAVLRELRGHADREAGRAVQRLLLTMPDPQTLTPGRDHDALRRGLLGAARLAGFTDVELLCEAAAIAMRVTLASQRASDYVLVCDAGAGALRLALVQAGTGRAGTDPGRVIAGRAIKELGGDAMDQELARDVRSRNAGGRRGAAAPGGPSQEAATSQEAWEYLRAAGRARERLSAEAECEESLHTLNRAPFAYRRGDLDRLLREPLRRLSRECKSLLATVPSAGRKPAAPTVLLVGGGARAPFLARVLSAELKTTVEPVEDPDFACFWGAVTWARHAGQRVIPALPHAPGTRGLSWDFKDGGAQLLRWLVPPGGAFASGGRLAIVRSLEDDSVCYLAADCFGSMRQHCVSDAGRPVVESGEVLAVIEARPSGPSDLASPYRIDSLRGIVAFSPDGRRALVRDLGTGCHEYNMDTGAWTGWECAIALDEAGGDVVGGPGRGWVAGRVTGRPDLDGPRAVEVTSMADGEPLTTPVKVSVDAPAAIRLSADGIRACVLAGRDIRVWEAGKKGRRRELLALRDQVPWGDPLLSFAFSRDGRTVLVVRQYQPSSPGMFRKKPPPGAELVAVRVPSEPIKEGRGVKLMDWPTIPVASPDLRLAVTADGGQVMLAVGHLLRVLDGNSGSPLWQAELAGPVRAAEFSADGSVLAVLTEQQPSWSGSLRDARDGSGLVQFSLGHLTPAWVRISPDMRFLAAGDESQSVVWGLLK